ncbi:hypothetical protein F4820DRAFT_133183 [Hypoxylon rubiginosum]|uniref:Uncharacterized protein n=1 Tax=Hypoxylon rubiginosum TaxID=110542 RepID=A0ACB9YKE0_9PEZI|nr:hypothetical protein F4820DRAFT_133183 [Hypoxylon rubiginosum]
MGIQRSGQSRNVPLLLLLTVVIFLFFRYTGTTTTGISDHQVAVEMPESGNNVIPKLQVSVRQVSSSPPKLGIAVTNAHAGPVTVLTWDSPLDPLALQLGLLSFVPAGGDDGSPIEIPTVQVRRRMPPGADSLATIGAGQTREQELELREPIVPLGRLRGTVVSVVCRGEWTSVWPSEADAISKESLANAGAGEDAFRGSFQSEAVDIEI